MTNKILSKEKEEYKSAVQEGNQENLALKRNKEEVCILLCKNITVHIQSYSWKTY